MSKWFRTPYTSSSDVREDRGRASVNVRRAAKARTRSVRFMRAVVILKRKDQTERQAQEEKNRKERRNENEGESLGPACDEEPRSVTRIYIVLEYYFYVFR